MIPKPYWGELLSKKIPWQSLCPSLWALSSRCTAPRFSHHQQPFHDSLLTPQGHVRCLHIRNKAQGSEKESSLDSNFLDGLPVNCPGCGGRSQTDSFGLAGYYSTARRPLWSYLSSKVAELGAHNISKESNVSVHELGAHNANGQHESVLQKDEKGTTKRQQEGPVLQIPLCDRCHQLIHHNEGKPITHLNMNSVQQLILESPYRYNHVYHVLDAADFPMSLVHNIQNFLDLNPQRSRNRRSSPTRYHHGRQADLSFIITRSDLIAPRKEQVDRLMPTLIEILRKALGLSGVNVRLGNIRCVSSQRGWWTKALKEDIWNRGGGSWLVGKANVGKSSLVESAFPKGRHDDLKLSRLNSHCQSSQQPAPEATLSKESKPRSSSPLLRQHDADALCNLPPATLEVPFPIMPTISHLPGTTASPIRLPFGNGRGELIDLPGLNRNGLTQHVRLDKELSLVMRTRPKPDQLVVKPGQSLMIADLVRIVISKPCSAVLLAAAFVPLKAHVTNSEKGAAIQRQEQESPAVSQLLKPGMGRNIESAGTFSLRWDVTKARSGPLTRKSAVGLRTESLPFVVMSADVLIEGVGWVELAVQLRKRGAEVSKQPPTVEIFSPFGKYVSSRRPLGAYLLGARMKKGSTRRAQRPRKPMNGSQKGRNALIQTA